MILAAGRFVDGRAIQHARREDDEHYLCGEARDLGRDFHAGRHADAMSALSAAGAGEINCPACRKRLLEL